MPLDVPRVGTSVKLYAKPRLSALTDDRENCGSKGHHASHLVVLTGCATIMKYRSIYA